MIDGAVNLKRKCRAGNCNLSIPEYQRREESPPGLFLLFAKTPVGACRRRREGEEGAVTVCVCCSQNRKGEKITSPNLPLFLDETNATANVAVSKWYLPYLVTTK